MQSSSLSVALCLVCFSFPLASWAAHDVPPSTPQVDLGYAIYSASVVNQSAGLVSFNNIRYAAPPVDALRFAPPVPPYNERALGAINASLGTKICPQAQPSWNNIAVPSLGSDANFTVPLGTSPLPQSEDCLLLDVHAPLKAFQSEHPVKGPVIVFIHGGGFVVGSKAAYNANGLLTLGGLEGVYVGIQYRLGAFGWLTDPSNKTAITPNLGLLDQRRALKWIQTHIGAFGGDPKRVTLVGESAGGGAVLYHSTAYGASKPEENELFARGIPQSPYVVNITAAQQTASLQSFLEVLNVKSIDEAKTKSSEELIAANANVTTPSRYGTYTWGPTIDGDLIPELPGKLQLEGSYIKSLQMMPGHNSDEGRLFTNQSAMTEADYDAYMRESYPGISSAALDYVTTTLYPAKYDGSLPYTTAVERLQVTVAESLFNCHCYGADRAYNTSAYDYTFAVPPGLHFQDTKYTFYNGPFPNVSETLAEDMQTYFTRFADKGSPNSDSALPYWPSFAEGEAGVLLKNEGISNGSKLDAAAVVRCLFWLSGDIFLENPASSVHHSDGSSKHVTGPL